MLFILWGNCKTSGGWGQWRYNFELGMVNYELRTKAPERHSLLKQGRRERGDLSNYFTRKGRKGIAEDAKKNGDGGCNVLVT